VQTATQLNTIVTRGRGHIDINQLILALNSITQRHRDDGWHAPHILGRQLPTQSRCVVIANIQGGILELYNYITHWRTQGILDNSFVLVDPHTYIFFVGACVEGSGSLIDTLAVIARLMAQNPGRVIYVPSQSELDGVESLQGLQDEIKQYYDGWQEEILGALKNWYATLPQAVYLQTDMDAKRPDSGPLVMTAYRDYIDTDRERWLGDFFGRINNRGWVTHSVNQSMFVEHAQYPRIAIDASFDGMQSLHHNDDVAMLLPVRAATVWRVWSCGHPSQTFQENNTHASYGIITLGISWATSDIRSYGGMCEKDAVIASGARYVLTSGCKVGDTQPLDAVLSELKIGSSLDLSKSNRAMGRGICVGISQAIKECNAAGGVGGRIIHPIILDDGYVPARARKNLDIFLQDLHVPTILLPVGSPTLEAAADLLHTDSLAVFFPVTGSPSFRTPEIVAVVTYRPSFQLESQVLVEYLLKQQLKNFAFFYQDDEYGTGVLARARKVLKDNHIDQWIEMPYARTATQFKSQVELLRKSQVEALGIFGSSQQAQEFLRQAGAETLSSMQLFANAFVVDAAFENFVRNVLGISFICTRLVPDPTHDPREIVREYRASMDSIGWPYEDNSIEAYITTRLLCHLMQEIGPEVTHISLLKKVESLNNYEYKGLVWTFDPEIRELRKETNIWLDFQDGRPWQPIDLTDKR
jgi:branched-chain amino acid transport system substrate-binding protein